MLDAALIATLAIGSVVAVFVIEWAPRGRNSSVAVIFAPWVGSSDAASRVANAGASLVRNGGFPFVMIVRPQTVDFTGAILREGALMVLDASAIHGCLGARQGP